MERSLRAWKQFHCFKDNKIKINLVQFQAIVLDTKKNNPIEEKLKTDNKATKVNLSVKLLGVEIGAELNVSLHISTTCRSTAN